MADGMEVTLYSVTLEKNIQGIIDAGGLSPEFGGSGGLAKVLDNDAMIERSMGKVFVSTHWAGVCNNVAYYISQHEKSDDTDDDEENDTDDDDEKIDEFDLKPVILRISIPLTMNEDQDQDEGNPLLRNMMKDPDTPEPAGAPRLGAYYFTQMIPTDFITFAAYSNNDDFYDENNENPSWEYRPLDQFMDSKAIFPDLPNPEIVDEDEEENKMFDITEELHEAMRRATLE